MPNDKYVGCDVHLATIVIDVLNSAGKSTMQAIVETKADPIRDFFQSLRGTVRVAFEEGPLSNWLFDLLSPIVAEVIVCDPRHNKLMQKGNRADKPDAAKIARLLRMGELQPVYHGQPAVWPLKELVRNYNCLTSDTVRVMNRIKAVYRSRAISSAKAAVFSKTHRNEWVAKVADSAARQRLDSLYLQLDFLKQLRNQARQRMLAEARRHPAYKLLRQVPGLGPIRVAELIAIVASPHRFRTKRQFWPYCGLAVVTRSTSDYAFVEGRLHKKRKAISTRGLNDNYNRRLKYILKSAALDAIKKEPMKSFYQRLLARGLPAALARLTVARKLAAILLAIWKKGDHFDPEQINEAA